MVNRQKVQAELEAVETQIRLLLDKLKEADRQRQVHLLAYLQNTVRRESAEILLSSTQDGIDLLRQFEKTFLQVLAYVLLLKDQGHKDPSFQLLLQRYKMLDVLIQDLHRIREKQVSLLAAILWDGHGLHRLPLQGYRRWCLKSLLREEDRIFLLIQTVYATNRRILEEIRERLEHERRKIMTIRLAATTSFLFPGVGTILFLTITGSYAWANSHSSNARALEVLAQQG